VRATALLQRFTKALLRTACQRAIARRDGVPPGFQGRAIAVQLDAHAVGEFDPIGKAMAGDCDHDRNVGAERSFDQVGKALAFTLLTSESVDDDEIGTLFDRACNLAAGVKQLPDIEPATGRTGPEILE